MSEGKLAAKLEKVTERLEADAPNMKLPGADLIAHYLGPDLKPSSLPILCGTPRLVVSAGPSKISQFGTYPASPGDRP